VCFVLGAVVTLVLAFFDGTSASVIEAQEVVIWAAVGDIALTE
jgi:hypothetical protein